MENKPDSVLFMGAAPEQVSTLTDHMDLARGAGWIRRAASGKLTADLAVYEVAGATLATPGQQRLAYDYAHELRRELARRKLLPVPSLRIPRCEVCKHGTERLFPTTSATHNIVGSNEKPVNAKVCVRCWSELHTGDSEESE